MMLPPDLALMSLINHTATVYTMHAPVYITYRERTHVNAPTLGRSQDINRTVAVRVADNLAVMRDLPDGGERTGQAFPIIPYFDPMSNFSFSYFANLKRVDITLDRGQPFMFTIPAIDPNANVTLPYFSFWAPRYAADSTDRNVHFTIDPTPRIESNVFYPSEVIEDASTQLPSHIAMQLNGTDEMIALDYQMIDGYWIITHGTFSSTQHAVFLTFKVIADITFDQFTFPTSAPDSRLAGSPTPATSSPVPAAPSASPIL